MKNNCQCTGECDCQPPSIFLGDSMKTCLPNTTVDLENKMKCVKIDKLLQQLFRNPPDQSQGLFKLPVELTNAWTKDGPLSYKNINFVNPTPFREPRYLKFIQKGRAGE